MQTLKSPFAGQVYNFANARNPMRLHALQNVDRVSPKVACVVLLAILTSVALWADDNVWKSLGPDGGGPFFLAIDPQSSSTVYALTPAGIFKSQDSGASWRATSPVPAVETSGGFTPTPLVLDPLVSGTLYAGTISSGIFKSTDGGASWKAVNSGITAVENPVLSLAIDPQNSTTIYATTLYGGVFKTIDGGENWNWTQVGPVVPGVVNIFVLAIHPRTGTLYAIAPSKGVFRSTDGGTNWTRAANSGLPDCPSWASPFVVDPQNDGTLFYVDSCAGLVKTTDEAETWNPILPYIYVNSLALDPGNTSIVYAGTHFGVLKSIDGGLSWHSGTWGQETYIGALAVDPRNPGTVYAGAPSGYLVKSTDAGESWNEASAGLRAVGVSRLLIDSSNPMNIYANGLKSTDGGQSWKRLERPYSELLVVDPAGTLYAAEHSGEATPGRLWKSTDGGASWNDVSKGLPLDECHSVSSLSVGPKDPSTLYAGVAVGSEYIACPGAEPGDVWRSTDGGLSWLRLAAIPEYDPTFPGVSGLVTHPQNTGIIYAWNEVGLFKSSDGGVSWSTLDSSAFRPIGSWRPTISKVVIDSQNPSTLYVVAERAGLFRSTDGGTTWRALTSGLPAVTSGPGPDEIHSVHTLAIDPDNSITLYAGSGIGVFRSTNGGETWSAVNSGLTSLSVSVLTIDPLNSSTLYAGTTGGVFVIRFVP
jgi:photosystem II stability/assembly factor-like uncharacterized protein